MPVSAAEFKKWLDSNSINVSQAALGAKTGINPGTLGNQIRRGNVAEATVVASARAHDIHPLEALAFFEPYSDALTRPTAPSQAELLSQVHHTDLMAELQFRTSQIHWPRSLRPDARLIEFPFRGSHRAWVDAIDTGDVRHRMVEETGMALGYLFEQLRENKLTPPLAIAASRAAGGSFATGLVVIQLLTPEEGEWPAHAREDAVRDIPDESLVNLIYARTYLLQRRLKQGKEVLEYPAGAQEIPEMHVNASTPPVDTQSQ